MSTRYSRKSSAHGKKEPSASQAKVGPEHAGNSETRLSEDERRRMIAEAAYYRAEQRGFSAGGEVDDWLTAEREILQLLQSSDASRRSGTTRVATPAGAKADARMETRPA